MYIMPVYVFGTYTPAVKRSSWNFDTARNIVAFEISLWAFYFSLLSINVCEATLVMIFKS